MMDSSLFAMRPYTTAPALNRNVRHGCLGQGREDCCRSGTGLEAAGAEEIDASWPLALMPGIIDTHTHFDAQITWDASVRPSPGAWRHDHRHGELRLHHCPPCKERDRDLVMKNLTQVEGMSLEALREGIDWGFETFPEYVSMLAGKGTVPNVACFFRVIALFARM